jgi:hypothetical protein
MTKTSDAAPAVAQGEIETAPQTGQNEALSVKIVRVGDNVVIEGKSFPLDRVREVCFERKDRTHFKVIAEIFNEGAGVFGRYAGAANNVVGLVEEKELPSIEKKLNAMDIRTLYLTL